MSPQLRREFTIKVFYRPHCPFCGVGLGRLEAFIVKNRSLYNCRACGNLSAVALRSNVYWLLWAVQIFSVVVFITALFLGEGFYLLGLIVMMTVFCGFYWFSPSMIKLQKPKYITRSIPWYKKIFRPRAKNNVRGNKTGYQDTQDDGGSDDDIKEIFSN